MIRSDEDRQPFGLLLGKFSRFNWVLLFLVVITTAIGVVAQYSVAGGSFSPWANDQIQRAVAGLILLFAIALTPTRLWQFLALPLYLVSVALLIAVELGGTAVKGAQRWLEIGQLRIQPSEFVKICLILALAALYAEMPFRRVSRPLWMAVALLVTLVPVLFVFRQPDLGTAVVIAAIGGIMMFAAGVQYRYFVAVAVLVAGTAAALLLSQDTDWQILEDYQYRRIETFLDPESDPFGAGYHTTQSKIAFGSGGLHGRGYLQGTQSQLNFLPEKHTDFVFTTLAEEFGLMWCLVILSFYGFISGYCIRFATKCTDRFCALLVIGLSSTFFLHFSANIAMVSGLMPVVGIPLPLISYGGTALLMSFATFGLIQSAHVHADRKVNT